VVRDKPKPGRQRSTPRQADIFLFFKVVPAWALPAWLNRLGLRAQPIFFSLFFFQGCLFWFFNLIVRFFFFFTEEKEKSAKKEKENPTCLPLKAGRLDAGGRFAPR